MIKHFGALYTWRRNKTKYHFIVLPFDLVSQSWVYTPICWLFYFVIYLWYTVLFTVLLSQCVFQFTLSWSDLHNSRIQCYIDAIVSRCLLRFFSPFYSILWFIEECWNIQTFVHFYFIGHFCLLHFENRLLLY